MIYHRIERKRERLILLLLYIQIKRERCVVDHDFGIKPVLGGGPTGLLDMGTVGSTPITDVPTLLSLFDNELAKFKDGEGDTLSIDNVC